MRVVITQPQLTLIRRIAVPHCLHRVPCRCSIMNNLFNLFFILFVLSGVKLYTKRALLYTIRYAPLATNKLNLYTICTIQNTSTNLLNLAYERFILVIIPYSLLQQSGVSVFGCGGAPMAKMCQNRA